MDKSKKFIIIKELKTGLPWIESILWFAIIRWPKKFSLKIQTVKDSQRCLGLSRVEKKRGNFWVKIISLQLVCCKHDLKQKKRKKTSGKKNN